MRPRTGLILIAASFLLTFNANTIFCQEDNISIENSKISMPNGMPGLEDIQWVWGEVVTSDPVKKTAVIRTQDYITDQEKEITIATDEKTSYDNISSIDEVRPTDTLSIDYCVSSDGSNVAKNISLERPESQFMPEIDSADTMPEDLRPANP